MEQKSTATPSPSAKIVISHGSNLRHYCATTHLTADGGRQTVHERVTIKPGANLLTADAFASVERDLRFDESRDSLQIVGSFSELGQNDAVRVTKGTIDPHMLALLASDNREAVRTAAAEQLKSSAKVEA